MSAGERYFVDSNVLLYLTDPVDTVRQSRAALWMDHLWGHHTGVVSGQVLHEFYWNATRKLRVPAEEARFLAGTLLEWRPVDTSALLLERAWHWTDEAQVAYWDALILAAAEISGCRYLLSEDFQDGRRFAGVEVMNPFRRGPGGEWGSSGAV